MRIKALLYTAVFLCLMATCSETSAQNLILNHSCDDSLVNGEIPFWQEIQGSLWRTRSSNPTSFAGDHYFYPGAITTAELGQVIDLGGDSVQIDDGTRQYYFSGYVRAFSQNPSDESNFLIHFLNEQDTVLSTVLMGPFDQTSVWLLVDSLMTAPVGTRKVDIRLFSEMNNGSNNDGYYDELYFGDDPFVSIRPIGMAGSILTYPNPTAGMVQVELGDHWTSAQLIVTDQLGRVISTANSSASTFTLDLSQQPGGLYFVRVESDGFLERFTIVVDSSLR